jgi:prefoldin subunit 5
MKSSSRSASTTAKMLNLVGVILVLSSFLDYVMLLQPPFKPSNIPSEQWQLTMLQWQQGVTSQLIDRGVIPMLGLAILFVAFWINRQSDSYQLSPLENLEKLVSIIIAALLGITFIVVPVLNFNSARMINNQTLEQIGKQAEQAEKALDAQSKQVNSLLQDNQKLGELDQAIKGGKVQGPQLDQLKQIQDRIGKLKQDPNALKKELTEAQTKIRTTKQELEGKAKSDFLKSAIRNVGSGLLLAGGYIIIVITALSGAKG